jgi:hypothetical protein
VKSESFSFDRSVASEAATGAGPSELNLWTRQWRDERIRKARADYRERASAYESLKNKATDYARSIKMTRDVSAQVLEVWESSPVDLPPMNGADTIGPDLMINPESLRPNWQEAR